MSLTVQSYAATRALTTGAMVLQELKLEAASADAEWIETLISQASAAVETYCERVFGRETVMEKIAGYGDTILQLERTPVLSVTSVLRNNEPITDAVIEDPEKGWLYRSTGWDWTAPTGWNLSDYRKSGQEAPDYIVTYVGGYLLPGDDYAAATISVSAADNSFNDSAGLFPNIAVGERLVADFFESSANRGTFPVVSRTASKIVVSGGTLVTEAATTADKLLKVRTLPFDVERACLETVKAWYVARTRDPNIVAKRLGDLSIQYRDPGPGGAVMSIPFTAAALLAPYRRLA